MKVWIITSEVNAYDQEGEYFEAVFSKKPDISDICKHGIGADTAEHLLKTGGGRRNCEDSWYFLREHDC